MPIVNYRDYEIDVQAAGFTGFNAYIEDPFGARVEALTDRIQLHVLEAARAFVDDHIRRNFVAVLDAEGDTNNADINEDPHTVWTYAPTQAVYEPLASVTELFVFAEDAGQTGTLLIRGTKAPGAALPHEFIVFSRTLNGQTPVSLAATPGSPTVEDLYDFRSMGPETVADTVTAGEIFITGAGSSGGVPDGNVYGHLAVTDGATRNESHIGFVTVPAGFEAAILGFTLGSHEDAIVWVEILLVNGIVLSTFRFPLRTQESRTFDPPAISGPVETPSRFPPGTRFRLMGQAKKAGGVNKTRLGGDIRLALFKVT